MASLTVISGVGGKLPAAFLLEIEGYRLLWDLGAGPEPGVRPAIAAIGQVDALCLTHSHVDHAAALDSWADIGSPPVYASDLTWQQLGECGVPQQARRILPLHGQCALGPLNLFTGRSGHSPGSIWFHLPVAGGITYMGDWSRESLLLPFDCPPRARLLITDGSYGDRNQRLAQQIDALAQAAAPGAVVTAPLHGRGPEMALQLSARGLPVVMCAQVREEVAQLLALSYQPDFRLIFSSHVAAGTRAAEMLQTGAARWLPWNVHPPLDDQLRLIRQTAAQQVIPAFVAPEQCRQLIDQSPATLCWQHHYPLSSRWESVV